MQFYNQKKMKLQIHLQIRFNFLILHSFQLLFHLQLLSSLLHSPLVKWKPLNNRNKSQTSKHSHGQLSDHHFPTAMPPSLPFRLPPALAPPAQEYLSKHFLPLRIIKCTHPKYAAAVALPLGVLLRAQHPPAAVLPAVQADWEGGCVERYVLRQCFGRGEGRGEGGRRRGDV